MHNNAIHDGSEVELRDGSPKKEETSPEAVANKEKSSPRTREKPDNLPKSLSAFHSLVFYIPKKSTLKRKATPVSKAERMRKVRSDLQAMKQQELRKLAIKFRLRESSGWQFGVAMFSLAIMIVEVELRWHGVASIACDVLKLGNSVCSAVLLGLTAWYYHEYVELCKARHYLPDDCPFTRAGVLMSFLLESLLLLIHPPPFAYLVNTYNLENMLSMLMFVRIYLVFRVIAVNDQLFSPSGEIATRLAKIPFSVPFVIRKRVYEAPQLYVTACFVVVTLVHAYAWLVFERGNEESVEWFTQPFNQPVTFGNALWVILITMFTVGYGDMYAVSAGGRVVTILVVILGTVLTALCIAVVQQHLQLDSQEMRVVKFLQREGLKRCAQNVAASCVQQAWLLKRPSLQDREARDAKLTLFGRLRRLRQHRESIARCSRGDPFNEVRRTQAEVRRISDMLRSQLSSPSERRPTAAA